MVIQKYSANDAPITFSLLFRRRRSRKRKVGIHCGDDLLGYERGELAVWLIWIRACVKAGLLDHLDQQECKPKKINCGNCVLNALTVLEDGISMFV